VFSCRYALYQHRPACLILSAALLLFAFVPEAYAQEGDPDQPMIVGMVPGPVAAVDMFIKIDGIEGEAEDKQHSDWIDVLSIAWGPTGTPVRATTTVRANTRVRQDGAQRKRPGRVKYGDVTLKKAYDASSASLAEACANGKHIPKLVLEWTTTDGDGSKYVRLEMEDVIISSYSIDATDGDRPTESISLNFAKVKSKYIPQEERGQAASSWKVETMDGKSTDN